MDSFQIVTDKNRTFGGGDSGQLTDSGTVDLSNQFIDTYPTIMKPPGWRLIGLQGTESPERVWSIGGIWLYQAATVV